MDLQTLHNAQSNLTLNGFNSETCDGCLFLVVGDFNDTLFELSTTEVFNQALEFSERNNKGENQ